MGGKENKDKKYFITLTRAADVALQTLVASAAVSATVAISARGTGDACVDKCKFIDEWCVQTQVSKANNLVKIKLHQTKNINQNILFTHRCCPCRRGHRWCQHSQHHR